MDTLDEYRYMCAETASVTKLFFPEARAAYKTISKCYNTNYDGARRILGVLESLQVQRESVVHM